MLGARASGSGNAQPLCVMVGTPPNVSVMRMEITRDGRTLVVLGTPKGGDGSAPQPRMYTRRLDRYEFNELPGTEGTIGFMLESDSRGLNFLAPVSPGAPQQRFARIPLDGSAPATTLTDWKDSWSDIVALASGDMLVREGQSTFVRLTKGVGAPSAPVTMDAGRPGVSFYQFTGTLLPDDKGVFVDVILYDARGWHYSVGVLDAKTGKVKVVEEDGGSARYSPTGQLLFARGDTILAVPFDPERLEPHGSPVAVWNGLSTQFTFIPGNFSVTDDGSLFFRPGQAGGDREFALLDTAGKLETWTPEKRSMDGAADVSPDGRRIAFSIVNGRGIDELWMSDLDHPGLRRLETDPNADCSSPLWSPDGRRIAYDRHGKDGKDGTYVQDPDGGEAKLVLKRESDDIRDIPSSWLPDGSALLLSRIGLGQGKLMMLTIAGGTDASRLRQILPGTSQKFIPKLSRDGRLLAFLSNESGKARTYVAELRPDGSTGRMVEVKTSGSFGHAWSGDGKTLFVEDERHRMVKVIVTGGPELSVSAPVQVHDLEKLRVAFWGLIPDGRLFVGLKNDNEDEITRYSLVLNWSDELKRNLRDAH
jgi:hypothetical protein